jgi:hypothetical protein
VPYHFDFDPQNRILRGTFEGHITDDDLKTGYRVAEQRAAQTSARSGLMDLSAATSLDVSPDTIRELAKSPPVFPDPSLTRVILAPTPQIFGMARMFELQGEGTRPSLHVVRTEAEAWAILGVQKPQFEPLPD